MSANNDAFVSYRRSDGSEKAAAISGYLEKNKIRTFFDTSDASRAELNGESFPEVLREGVRNASAFILVVTPDVFPFRQKEDWVLEEIKTALEMRRQSEDYKIILLMCDGAELPSELPK